MYKLDQILKTRKEKIESHIGDYIDSRYSHVLNLFLAKLFGEFHSHLNCMKITTTTKKQMNKNRIARILLNFQFQFWLWIHVLFKLIQLSILTSYFLIQNVFDMNVIIHISKKIPLDISAIIPTYSIFSAITACLKSCVVVISIVIFKFIDGLCKYNTDFNQSK